MSYLALARKWRAAFLRRAGRPGARARGARQRARRRAACTTPSCSPARAASARPPSRASSPSASTARPASPPTPCGECAACREIDDGPLRRPHRSRRRLAHQGRRHARAARQRAVRADARPLQGLPDRRSAHALDALVQRAAEDARGAAAAREVPARDHRSAEAAGDGAVALPAVQPQAPAGGADQRAPEARCSTAEKIPADAAGVRLVAQAADGSMRDALSLLDQLIAFGGGKVDEAGARACSAPSTAITSCSSRARSASGDARR